MTKSERGKLSRISAVPARSETSALISLEELLLLEQSRIRDEEAQRRAIEERMIRERMEAEARAQEAERAKLRAEEAARVEALRLGDARRARMEAESAQAMAVARMHAESAAKIQMMQLASQKAEELDIATRRGRSQTSWALRATGLLGLLALGTLGFLLHRSEARALSLQVALTQAEDARDEQGRKLAHMVPEDERDALQAKIRRYEDELRSRSNAPPPAPRSAATSPGNTVGARAPAKSPGADPCAFYRKLRETNPQDPRLFDPANGCL